MNFLKKISKILFVLFILFLCGIGYFLYRYSNVLGINFIAPTTEKYVKQAITFMDNQGIYNHTEAWETVRKEVLEETKKCKSYEETYPYLEKALKTVGGKHSKLILPSTQEETEVAVMPEVKMIDTTIAYIKLPEFIGNAQQGEEYANIVYEFLRENANMQGVIIDLQNNTGGDMGPMIAAISPLLPDGEVLDFYIQSTIHPVMIDNGKISGGGSALTMDSPFKITGIPIAILQNEMTASSAEATLLAFRGLENTKTFGKASAGYCSCNTTRSLYDGAILQLTIGYDVPRTQEFFCEDPIEPDVSCESALDNAKQWIIQ